MSQKYSYGYNVLQNKYENRFFRKENAFFYFVHRNYYDYAYIVLHPLYGLVIRFRLFHFSTCFVVRTFYGS